jgi:hypothetical protein
MKKGDRIRRNEKGEHNLVPSGMLGRIVGIASPHPCNGYWLVRFDNGVVGAFDEPFLDEMVEA